MNNQPFNQQLREFVPSWNVVDGEDFHSRVRNVFKRVAETLVHTLGPEGSNTIIEQHGDIHITKDGWNILKKITFNENVDNTILQLLINIASQVVIKVGDGSTSSIVAAHELLTSIESSDSLGNFRPKKVIDTINKIANDISKEIVVRSNKIDYTTPEGLQDIYRLALVSTNGDIDIADIIRTIYEKTANPTIEYVKSKTNETTYEIIEGYRSPISYLDRIYINNSEDGTCVIQKPIILMFDHSINKEDHWVNIISEVANQAALANRRLVVIAPYFDKGLLEHIRITTNIEAKTQRPIQTLYCRVSLVNNLFNDYYKDFSIMTGADIITMSDMDRILGRDKVVDRSPNHHLLNPNDATEIEVEEVEPEVISLDAFIGEVDKISIGANQTTIVGFHKRSEQMYEVAKNDAVARYNKLQESNAEMNVMNPEVFDLKKRVSKLQGIMGMIHVGGNSYLEKVANYDLVDDAVRATESASTHGYNIGGNLIIPLVISDLRNESTDELENELFDLFTKAFRSVYGRVLSNKYKNETVAEIDARIDQSIENKQVFNLITEEFDGGVINPCYTDIEILRAVSSIVSMIKGSNQFVSIKADTSFE